jgi:hypothetical protein
MSDQIEYIQKCQKIINSFNGDFDCEVEINGTILKIQREVFDLLENISSELDKLKS